MERPKCHGFVGFYPNATDYWGSASRTCTWSYEGGRSTWSKPEALRQVLNWIWQTHGLVEGTPASELQAKRASQEAEHRVQYGEEFLGPEAGQPSEANQRKKRKTRWPRETR